MTDLYTALTLDDNALMKTVIENADVDAPEGTDMTRYVKAVCGDINTLTFNRITDYFGLTAFQQKRFSASVRECCIFAMRTQRSLTAS
jgi:hypothetical protein